MEDIINSYYITVLVNMIDDMVIPNSESVYSTVD